MCSSDLCLDFQAEDRLTPRCHVGQACGKASRESHRSLDAHKGKSDTAATAREESARACPHSRGGILSLRGRERISEVPVASQEEALSTGKARGTPGSFHHSQITPDVSVHSRETCFPCTASTFNPKIDSHNGGTWDRPVGKPRGKATDPLIHAKGSVTLLLQLGRKAHVHAPTRDED